MQHIHTGAGIKKDQSLLGPDPFSVLLQQQAEHQGEQSHRFDNTNDDEVVGRALSGFTQSICGGLGHLALEKGGQADGQTRKDTGEHSQQRVTAALHSAADEVHQQEAIDGLGQGSTGESHHDKGGGLAVDVAFFLRADRSLCGKAGTECRAHGGQTQSARQNRRVPYAPENYQRHRFGGASASPWHWWIWSRWCSSGSLPSVRDNAFTARCSCWAPESAFSPAP